MLTWLASFDKAGELLDKCEGNVKAAFAMMLSNRLYFLHQIHLDQSIDNLSRRFNIANPKLPLAFTGDAQNWGFKIISIARPLELSFEMEAIS
ncbi:hypothetical protein [Pseudoalteromonas denitrificans]|uniref:Uncharacterized protein n=1 Tax=Pseudoalteromonas denitrificans DSM 6059 TaxID=1123010 RepID=A0A1I1G3A2_9GAMM|nr:hypothetical protein [Pseudoalteromonas denitrificans]SFC04308.1 hypothetical protein SAMN02745724_00739 [Pseudoalteromonas denitrificans DSM 6059]